MDLNSSMGYSNADLDCSPFENRCIFKKTYIYIYIERERIEFNHVFHYLINKAPKNTCLVLYVVFILVFKFSVVNHYHVLLCGTKRPHWRFHESGWFIFSQTRLGNYLRMIFIYIYIIYIYIYRYSFLEKNVYPNH